MHLDPIDESAGARVEPSGPRVLVVDDEESLLRVHARALRRAGYRVETALDGVAAAKALEAGSFDVILSDIDMPGMDGFQLLAKVRERDLDVPLVLITGNPSLETAIQAMDQGALRYLVKPVALEQLLKVTGTAARLHVVAKAKRGALDLAGGGDRFAGDLAGLASSFARALDSLTIAYQPIVSSSKGTIYAYEALLRSSEPSLPHPGAVLNAAERLDRVHELGRRVRALAAAPIASLPADALLFVNLHPEDLYDAELFEPASPLGQVAHRVVLEITERASLDRCADVRARVASLRALGFRIAIDDLGSGYSGLTSFSLLEPDVVKLDMALIRGLDVDPMKRTLVRTMVDMCRELGITVTSEGIETQAEREAVAQVGCDLMQGYLFARPGPAFPVPTF